MNTRSKHSIPLRLPARYLYTIASVVLMLIVLVGFSQTYFLRGVFNSTKEMSVLLHVHGVIMTTWFVLLIVQSTLIAKRQIAVHRRLGIFGALLAVAILLVGTASAITAAERAGATTGAMRFLAIPLGDMVVFGTLAGLGIYWRKRGDIHKRLLLLASAAMLPAAVARVPLHFIESGGPPAFFGMVDTLIVGFAAYDTWMTRRLHPAFLWGTLFVIVSQPLRLLISTTAIWEQLASWLVR